MYGWVDFYYDNGLPFCRPPFTFTLLYVFTFSFYFILRRKSFEHEMLRRNPILLHILLHILLDQFVALIVKVIKH